MYKFAIILSFRPFDQRRYIFKIGLALNYDRKIEMK